MAVQWMLQPGLDSQHRDLNDILLFRILATQMTKGKAKVRRHWPDFCAKLTATIRSVIGISFCREEEEEEGEGARGRVAMPVPQRRTCEALHEIQSKVSNARKQQESS